METWRMDLKSARWIADNFEKIPLNEPFSMEECEKCGASYFKDLGHDCNNIIDLKMQDIKQNKGVM